MLLGVLFVRMFVRIQLALCFLRQAMFRFLDRDERIDDQSTSTDVDAC